jgi:glycosyltransferase involved in cell wall biosynthesis
MNVLFVIHYPIFGGPHNQALLLARDLNELGVNMTVLLPTEAGNAAQRFRSAGIDVVSIPLNRVRASFDPRKHMRLTATFPRDVARIREVVRARESDIVQIGGLVNPHAAIAGRLENAAVVWQLLDTRPPMALRRIMMPLVTRLSDVVMTTGKAVARTHPGAESLGERLSPFFPPVDAEVFSPTNVDREAARARFGVEPGDRLIGTVGNLNPQKGHEFLIRGASLVRESLPDVRLLIVGASHDTHRSYERRLLALARDLGLVVGRDVFFAGSLTDVRPALGAMDLFVLSSVPRSEGAPTAIEEAMMMEKPVVATDVGAVAEVVTDGETGYVVPPLSPKAIADAALRILEDPGLARRMAVRGRERALASFTADECARIHVDAYERALAHRRSSRSRRSRP